MATTGIEIPNGYAWLMTTLNIASVTTLATGGVFADLAPSGIAPPFLVFGFQGGRDIIGSEAIRLLSQGVFFIRAVGLASQYATLVSIMAVVDPLVQRQGGTAGGNTIMMANREQAINLTQQLNNVQWVYTGGLYRLYIV